ncbi:MAG TPA: MFS transporter [Bdellovibrionota bacterium]|nr:MFS transporter [Bdellovibrionota bacterium]
MSAFRASFPLVITSFVNKCGTIGLNLLPMLLVERQISAGDSSLVMTLVKVAAVGGLFLGGWTSDRLGMKKTILFSFIISGITLALIPFTPDLFTLTLASIVSSGAIAMFPAASRLLLVELVPFHLQQESIAWLRTALNFGQVVCYSIGTIFSRWGILILFLFDSCTSILAAGIGAKILPRLEVTQQKVSSVSSEEKPNSASWNMFFLCALILGGYSFLYELFFIGAAAKYKILFGDEALRIFSVIMLINTVLCSIFAVVAARAIKNPNIAFPLGIIFVALGTSLAVSGTPSLPIIYLGAFVVTIGEIIFTAVGMFMMIRMTPESKDRGAVYGFGMVIQHSVRILGGALAFPMIVHGSHPVPFITGSAIFILFLITLSWRGLARFAPAQEPG